MTDTWEQILRRGLSHPMKTTYAPLEAKSGKFEGRLDDSYVITGLSPKFENPFLNTIMHRDVDLKIKE